MDMTERLRAWGAAHAQARSAECAGAADPSPELQREAKALRERADRLHRQIYRGLDRKDARDPPR